MRIEEIDKVVQYINNELESKLAERLLSAYLVGSYPQGGVSLLRPDVNWLLIWHNFVTGEDNWVLGEILTGTINKYKGTLAVRPEFRPFKFSYPYQKSDNEIFVNISSVFNANSDKEFKEKNSFIPEYVFAGFRESRKLIFGKDILELMKFVVSKASIQSSAIPKTMSHKVQLDRVPLVYHLQKDIDLVYNESLSHGKNLLYFAVELAMSDSELEKGKHLSLIKNKEQMLNFLEERFPEIVESSRIILESKDNYNQWKNDIERAKNLYLASTSVVGLLLRRISR